MEAGSDSDGNGSSDVADRLIGRLSSVSIIFKCGRRSSGSGNARDAGTCARRIIYADPTRKKVHRNIR